MNFFSGEQDQLKLYDFFLILIRNSNVIDPTIKKEISLDSLEKSLPELSQIEMNKKLINKVFEEDKDLSNVLNKNNPMKLIFKSGFY